MSDNAWYELEAACAKWPYPDLLDSIHGMQNAYAEYVAAYRQAIISNLCRACNQADASAPYMNACNQAANSIQNYQGAVWPFNNLNAYHPYSPYRPC